MIERVPPALGCLLPRRIHHRQTGNPQDPRIREAYRLVAAKNGENEDAPAFSLHLKRVYWKAGDPVGATRTAAARHGRNPETQNRRNATSLVDRHQGPGIRFDPQFGGAGNPGRAFSEGAGNGSSVSTNNTCAGSTISLLI